MKKTIFDLKLHETLQVSNTCDVIKVPGGWIYVFYSIQDYEGGRLVYPHTTQFVVDNESTFDNDKIKI